MWREDTQKSGAIAEHWACFPDHSLWFYLGYPECEERRSFISSRKISHFQKSPPRASASMVGTSSKHTESGLDQRKAEIHGIAGGPWTSALLSSHFGAVGLPGTWKCGESSRPRGSDETPEAPQPWVGPGWKSVKLSHETSPLPPGSVWTGNTMRITLLLAFQQFCFRAWAKQGSAEAWEPRGDTNTWEHRMNGSKSLHSTHCLHQGFSCQLNSSAWADTFRWRWLSVGQILLSLRQQSTPRNNSTFTAMRQEQDLGAF